MGDRGLLPHFAYAPEDAGHNEGGNGHELFTDLLAAGTAGVGAPESASGAGAGMEAGVMGLSGTPQVSLHMSGPLDGMMLSISPEEINQVLSLTSLGPSLATPGTTQPTQHEPPARCNAPEPPQLLSAIATDQAASAPCISNAGPSAAVGQGQRQSHGHGHSGFSGGHTPAPPPPWLAFQQQQQGQQQQTQPQQQQRTAYALASEPPVQHQLPHMHNHHLQTPPSPPPQQQQHLMQAQCHMLLPADGMMPPIVPDATAALILTPAPEYTCYQEPASDGGYACGAVEGDGNGTGTRSQRGSSTQILAAMVAAAVGDGNAGGVGKCAGFDDGFTAPDNWAATPGVHETTSISNGSVSSQSQSYSQSLSHSYSQSQSHNHRQSYGGGDEVQQAWMAAGAGVGAKHDALPAPSTHPSPAYHAATLQQGGSDACYSQSRGQKTQAELSYSTDSGESGRRSTPGLLPPATKGKTSVFPGDPSLGRGADKGLIPAVRGTAGTVELPRVSTGSPRPPVTSNASKMHCLDGINTLLTDFHLFAPNAAATATRGTLAGGVTASGAAEAAPTAPAPVPRTEMERRAAQSAEASRWMVESDRVVAELLVHLGYTEAQAESAIQGSFSCFSTAAANAIQHPLRLRAGLLGLFLRFLETSAAPASPPSSLAGGVSGDGGDAPLDPSAAALAQLQMHSGVGDQLLRQLREKLKATACLIWAHANIVDPRPPRHIKLSLAAYTGKTSKQVTDWFTNWRARHWRPTIMALDVEGGGGGGADGSQSGGATGGRGSGAGGSRSGQRHGSLDEDGTEEEEADEGWAPQSPGGAGGYA